MREISVNELLKAGAHFGHQSSKWHPRMAQFIFSARNGIHILNLEKTAASLDTARKFAYELALTGKTILFIGTKRQAKDLVRKAAQSAGMPFVVERWIGGTFTNFSHVSGLLKKLFSLEQNRDGEDFNAHYTKKERLVIAREIKHLEVLIGGIRELDRLPDAVFIVDIRKEKTALREAQRTKVPIIAIVDSNCNPDDVTYPIPANDDATKTIEYITECIAEAVREGKEDRAKREAEEQADTQAKSDAEGTPESVTSDTVHAATQN